MSRQEDFIEAGIQYRFAHGTPMAIGGGHLAEMVREMNRTKPYEEGAEHGYQYAVDNACEWLRENIYNRVYECGDRLGYPTADFLKDFRKAMEDMCNEQENKRKGGTTTVIQTNEKSANSVSITSGRTDVTDGTLPDGAIIMQ